MQITVHKEGHTCQSTSGATRMASVEWVAQKLAAELKQNPSCRAIDLMDVLKKKYGMDLPYHTVWSGRLRALEKLYGSWEMTFDWLYRFKAQIEKDAPGSVVEIDTVEKDGQHHFRRFFCCLSPCIQGFLMALRPYLSIDATHLTGTWDGQLAGVCALDGNNWMYPLAFGFFYRETTDSWTWFLQKLHRAIGSPQDLTISSDHCKGLELAVKKVFPAAEHRECFRHLMGNLAHGHSGNLFKLMYPAARTFMPDKHERLMSTIYEGCPSLKEWLSKHHSLLWARSKFGTGCKVDYINNNLAESFNSWVKGLKDLTLDAMADAIVTKMMVLWNKRKKVAKGLDMVGTLPSVVHQLNARTRRLGNLHAISGSDNTAQVLEVHETEEMVRHVVRLDRRTCTCREWQVTGKPCPHALKVITSRRNEDVGQYCHHWFHTIEFKLAYDAEIPALCDRSQWAEVEKGFVLQPPLMSKKAPGRPKKNRHPSALEKASTSKNTGKIKRQSFCSACGGSGHRIGSKKCPVAGPKKRYAILVALCNLFSVGSSLVHIACCIFLAFLFQEQKQSEQTPVWKAEGPC